MPELASDLRARLRAAATGSGATPAPPPPDAAVDAETRPARRTRQRTRTAPEAPPAAPAPVPAKRRRAEPTPAEPASRATVRYTLELERGQRRELAIAALDLGADASEIVRALLAELAEDQRLARRVAARVRAGRMAQLGDGGPA